MAEQTRRAALGRAYDRDVVRDRTIVALHFLFAAIAGVAYWTRPGIAPSPAGRFGATVFFHLLMVCWPFALSWIAVARLPLAKISRFVTWATLFAASSLLASLVYSGLFAEFLPGSPALWAVGHGIFLYAVAKIVRN